MVEWFPRTAKMAIKTTMVAASLLILSSAASAQQAMTVEELENFILKKKTDLTDAIEQRDETLDKRAELDQKRTEQAQRQRALEQELRSLCDKREEAEPGSLETCLKELNLASN